jgi:hypothetical protein
MTETITSSKDERIVVADRKTVGKLILPSNRNELKPIKIHGTLTSQFQLRGETTPTLIIMTKRPVH